MKDSSEPSPFWYGTLRFASWIAAHVLFHRQILRNEIRNTKGPYVVIANHGCALDFVNLIGLTRRHLHFVVSYCIFSRLPFRQFASSVGLIPKQQFQTKPADLVAMKRVVQNGEPLVIFPAGLMCEDGLSTPIPGATWRFLKWLGVDVYAARSSGSYLVMPKWASGIRPGKTTVDTYRLFSHEELETLTESEIRQRVEEALLFDDYREQQKRHAPNRRYRSIEGLENVLYQCPHCQAEASMVTEKDTIRCTACGFTERSDKNALLHHVGGPGEEISYVSDWSQKIRENIRQRLVNGSLSKWEDQIKLQLLDPEHKDFTDIGSGTLCYTKGQMHYIGSMKGENVDMVLPIPKQPTLPFKPGHHVEIQQGDIVYRCLPAHPKLLMQLISMVELQFEMDRS